MVSEMRGDLTYYGRIRLWGSIGFIVTVMLSSFLMDWQGTDALIWFCGLLLVFVLGAAFRLKEVPRLQHADEPPALLTILRRKEVLAFFASTALMVAAHAALYTFYSLYLEKQGYSKTVTGLMWSLGVVAEVLCFYYQAPLFKRWGVKALMYACFAFGVLRFAVIGAGAQSLALLVLAQLMHAATFALRHSASVQTMQRWFSGPLQARGHALYISISYGLGASAGSLALTEVWQRAGPQAIYYVASGLVAGGWCAAALAYRWQRGA
jgi:PPP family 3-phenylpropionic acid transporter